MSYKALLFCPDEKTARTVTQVLSELDFQVEPCLEPFATVKRLTSEHFDALVVDCENEQNATLLFKSARNSGLNQASLSIAVVEGQTGVAKAFRIGANLVLTKPINVEQSKGTIRVARGLLRKSEAAKPAAPSTRADQATQSFASTPRAPISPVPTPGPSSTFEIEPEPEPQPEATEAALLESMPDPAAGLGLAAASAQAARTNPWQPISQPMVSALRTAAEDTAQAESPAEIPPNPAFASSASSAAAAAPAKQKPALGKETESYEMGLPSFAASAEKPKPVRSSDAGGSKKTVLIAAVVLVALGIGYIGMGKIHNGLTTSKSAAKPQVVQPSVPAAVPAAPAPEQTAASESPAALSAFPTNPSITRETSAAKPKKAAIASSDADVSAGEEKTDVTAPKAIVVKSASQKPAPAAPQQTTDDAAPALDVASGSDNDAISGLVNVSPAVPHQALQTVKVSQGVSQGLLVRKVPPVYPQQALQMRIQGPVQSMATISKTGNISNLKLLSGDAILGRAAMDAVKQWKYKPYYLDNQPVDIQTQITVNFKLP
jgi:TonB family protein